MHSAHQLEALERRKQIEHGRHRLLEYRLLDVAPERLPDIVGATDDQLTPVRLAEVDTDIGAVDDDIDQRFDRFRHEGGEVDGLERQAQTDGFGQRGGVARYHHRDLVGEHRAAVGLYPFDAAIRSAQQCGDRGVLVQLDALVVGRTGKAPGHCVMPADRRIRMQHAGQDRQAGIRPAAGQRRDAPTHFVHADLFVGGAVVVHVEHAPAQVAQLRRRLHDIDHAALGIHEVEVELVGELVEQRHRLDVERNAFVAQVVGADRHRVARDVAAAQPAPFEHRDVGDAVLARQVVGGRQAMPSGADDDDFVARAQRGAAPCPLPVLVVRQGVARQRKKGIALHLPDLPVVQQFVFDPAGAFQQRLVSMHGTDQLHAQRQPGAAAGQWQADGGNPEQRPHPAE